MSFSSGDEFIIGDKEVQLDFAIPSADYLSGKCFGRNAGVVSPPPRLDANVTSTKWKPPIPKASSNLSAPFKHPSTISKPFKPPLTEKQPKEVIVIDDDQPSTFKDLKSEKSFWTVNWRKQTMKVHKTWEGDGILAQEGLKLTLFNEKRRMMGSETWNGAPLRSGTNLTIGGKEVELGYEISEDDYNSPEFDPANPPVPSSRLYNETVSKPHKFVTPISKTSRPQWATSLSTKPVSKGQPLYDPNAPDAIVMKDPSPSHQAKHNKKNLPVVKVVIDPLLGQRLRPHQIEGVKFMYESITGMRKHEGNGCILADEMGLGKTLQTITLIWTVLKQNPYSGNGPLVGKVMIVCPVSLVNNWRKEFIKWLGRDRVGVFIGDKDKAKIKQFTNSKIHNVLIIGYEKLRGVIGDLAYCNPPIGLIVCDEGHRLKSANNKTTKMFEALRTKRRIILSGTPIQNDLGEFHAMTDFCNPGLLDDYKTFNRIFETPIVKSRSPDCSEQTRVLGTARSEQLLEISKSFVLRRTADILNNYLPPKHEYVVFVRPTDLQISVFNAILKPDAVDSAVHGSTAKSLALIQRLGKVCNSPALLKRDKSKGQDVPANIQAGIDILPANTKEDNFELSGKLIFLARFLEMLRQRTDEKCIVVSNFTATLNIIEALCQARKYTSLRLDGSTDVKKRQEYVDEFNKSSQRSRFIFLLSSKAGGVGLNLIGASRLVLFDGDWNPAHDLQAMARIHRDGQKRPVFIYRLVTAGTIDEKIFQRQVTKMGLSDSLLAQATSDTNGKSSKDDFTPSQLKDLFTVNFRTACHTHELLECGCEERRRKDLDPDAEDVDISKPDDDNESDDELPKGFVVATELNPEKQERKLRKQKKTGLASLQDWVHVNCLEDSPQEYIQDTLLQRLLHSPGKDVKQRQEDSDEDVFDEDVDVNTSSKSRAVDVHRLPGGTMTFLFEKKSKNALDVVS
ncbi:helicase [Tulasnella sp. 403]|nr:helicase [Tulasnella sp. 403]